MSAEESSSASPTDPNSSTSVEATFDGPTGPLMSDTLQEISEVTVPPSATDDDVDLDLLPPPSLNISGGGGCFGCCLPKSQIEKKIDATLEDRKKRNNSTKSNGRALEEKSSTGRDVNFNDDEASKPREFDLPDLCEGEGSNANDRGKPDPDNFLQTFLQLVYTIFFFNLIGKQQKKTITYK